MSRFVRPSKYRHVFGQPAKKEHTIENVKLSNSAWDTNLIDASARYISVNWQASGGGAFAILPLPSPFNPPPHNLPYKLPDMIPLARGHTAPVLDTAWSPFNDSVVVSAGEDGKILVWKVEDSAFDHWGTEHWEPEDFDPVARLSGSGRKVGQVAFHPTASHVLASASGDYLVKLWDLENADDPRVTFTGHTDTVQSFAFNSTGTLLVTTCRDRKVRIFDPRTGGDAVRVAEGHGGIKGARIAWMGNHDRFATTGFSKMSDRQVTIWEGSNLKTIKTISIDQSAGVVMPFWSDNNILFLAGKGDGNIRYYEYDSDSLHVLSEHKSGEPQRGMCFLPRRALNVSECEIARAYKVAGSCVEPIAFICPRKADVFQSDIFPPAPSAEPSLTASEFFNGKVAQPKLIDLDTGFISSATSAAPPVTPSPAPASAPASAPPATPRTASMPKSYTAPAALTIAETPQMDRLKAENSASEAPTPRSSASAFPDEELSLENVRLVNELRDARAQIRNLELQVETMRTNASKAAKLLEGSVP
ncbi:hypothetical protein BOTBODRAFT_181389 [Botryobasidium botryosum FD-172 SS1]|uniref:Coronin n=1 Tax=Botryobasidium botryosum (strain FD-172 SS1) TaxID=930990 RepID=A0A067LWE8_BOTB1|nr:hypothetical protein BOTBODRAFT_181389 [Botryobasidium botryosum FD-172 SS1]